MDTAIAKLKQRFSEPPTEILEENNKCSICWSDYEEDHRPVKLPCGHIFREECILSWAQRTTLSGRYQRCPFCQAELIPTSLRSRASVLVLVPVHVIGNLWREGLEFYGGIWGMILAFGLGIGRDAFQQFSESEMCRMIELGLKVCQFLFMMIRRVKTAGWKRMLFRTAMDVVGEYFVEWQRVSFYLVTMLLEEWLMANR